MAKVIQVIEAEVMRGKGVEGDPIRRVTQYWSFDGDILAEADPIPCPTPTPFQSSAVERPFPTKMCP